MELSFIETIGGAGYNKKQDGSEKAGAKSRWFPRKYGDPAFSPRQLSVRQLKDPLLKAP